jgi:hypothetical protein
MTEEFIDVYGNYAIKLLRLQNDLAIGVGIGDPRTHKTVISSRRGESDSASWSLSSARPWLQRNAGQIAAVIE